MRNASVMIPATITFVILLMIGCSHQSDSPDASGLDTLVSWMSGYFSSEHQALQDSTYRDVRLHMVPVWKDREDGYWLYVEQSVVEYPEQPYRQRVYHVFQDRHFIF